MNATGGIASVQCVRSAHSGPIKLDRPDNSNTKFYFCFVTRGEIAVRHDSSDDHKVGENESVFFAAGSEWSINASDNTQFLEVSIYE
jgi:hypothetical protein